MVNKQNGIYYVHGKILGQHDENNVISSKIGKVRCTLSQINDVIVDPDINVQPLPLNVRFDSVEDDNESGVPINYTKIFDSDEENLGRDEQNEMKRKQL
jgi:hypothetical protein